MTRAVVVPCALYPQYLPEALESIERQRPRFDLVVLVLDAKPDRSPEVRQQYRNIFADFMRDAKSGVVLRALLGDRPHGVSRARNAGFASVLDVWDRPIDEEGLQGALFDERAVEWVTLLDEDDKLDVKYNARMEQAAALVPDVDVWYPDWLEFGPAMREPSHTTPEFSLAALKRAPFVPCGSTLRLSAWKRAKERNGEGFDSALTDRGLRWEDHLLFLELALLGCRFARVGEALWWHREHGTSGTTIANLTIKAWRKYAREKIKRLYDVDIGGNDV